MFGYMVFSDFRLGFFKGGGGWQPFLSCKFFTLCLEREKENQVKYNPIFLNRK
ncbi:hypothetical protein Hanom_Chr01g00032081 [Helianthus anomalus]